MTRATTSLSFQCASRTKRTGDLAQAMSMRMGLDLWIGNNILSIRHESRKRPRHVGNNAVAEAYRRVCDASQVSCAVTYGLVLTYQWISFPIVVMKPHAKRFAVSQVLLILWTRVAPLCFARAYSWGKRREWVELWFGAESFFKSFEDPVVWFGKFCYILLRGNSKTSLSHHGWLQGGLNSAFGRAGDWLWQVVAVM